MSTETATLPETQSEPQIPALAVTAGSASSWVPIDDVLAIIRDHRWSWVRNNPCKYIELRVDTRDGRCLIFDRDSRAINLHELSRQLDGYLSPNVKGQPRGQNTK